LNIINGHFSKVTIGQQVERVRLTIILLVVSSKLAQRYIMPTTYFMN